MATKTSRAAVLMFSVLCCISGTQCVSCDFQTGMCGWQNQISSAVKWQRGYCLNIWCDFDNYIMMLNMDKANVNDTGLLLSPILNDSADETRLLRFDYYINGSDVCKLSVLLLEAQSLTLLWNTTTTTTGNNFLISPNISLSCGKDRCQIILEGKKTSEKPCKIEIDNIVYEKGGTTPTSSPPPLSTPTTSTTTHSTTRDESPASESAAVIIIIVIIVAVIIMFVVAIYVYLLRRRAVAEGRTAHWTIRLFSTCHRKPALSIHTSSDISSIQSFPDRSTTLDHNVPSEESGSEVQYMNQGADSTYQNTQHRPHEVLANQNNPYESLNRSDSENRPYDELFVIGGNADNYVNCLYPK